MKRRFACLLLSGIVLAPVACGTADEAVKPVGPSVSDLVQSFCDTAFRCCSDGEVGFFLGPYLTPFNCNVRLTHAAELSPSMLFPLIELRGLSLRVPNVGALDRAAKEKRGGLDGDAVSACLEFLDGLDCNEYTEEESGCRPPNPPSQNTPCDPRKLFIGNLAAGEACTSGTGSLECAPGLLCRTSGNELGVKGQCVRPGTLGNLCFADVECSEDEGLYCSQLDGTCQFLRKEGETCVYSDRENPAPAMETLLLRCEDHLSCDPVSDVCVALCQPGAACLTDLDCDEAQELVCISGRCDKLRGEGQACAENDDCLEELVCTVDRNDPTSTVCQTKLPVGDLCVLHEDCEAGFCNPDEYRCDLPVPAGDLCPSGDNAECLQGSCASEAIVCTEDADCLGSNACDIATNTCVPYCVPAKIDGAMCIEDAECDSENCIRGFCRSLPLANGVGCELSEQCENEYCSLDDEPVCKELPLPLGNPCALPTDCESLVCYDGNPDDFTDGPECTPGLEEDDPCGDADQPPCDPKRFYCDLELDEPLCVPLLETGEECKGAHQCRGLCVANFGRMMCDPTPAPETAVCDGEGTSGGAASGDESMSSE